MAAVAAAARIQREKASAMVGAAAALAVVGSAVAVAVAGAGTAMGSGVLFWAPRRWGVL